MSRYVNVRGKHRHAPRAENRHAPSAAHGPVDKAPLERETFARNMREQAEKFFGVDELDKAIKFFLETLDAHSEELAELRANPKGFQIENYRWKIAPSVAMRAAKALIDALETRRIRRTQAAELTSAGIARQFPAPNPTHDAAVTEAPESTPESAPAWGEAPAHEPALNLNQINTLVKDARRELALPRTG